MRRKNKRKTKKLLLIVTVLLLLLYGAMLMIEGFQKDDESENIDEQPVKTPVEEPTREPNPNEEPTEELTKEPNEEPEEPTSVEPEQPSSNNGNSEQIIVENPEAIDVLVNRINNIPDTYVPEDLVTLTEVPTVLTNPEVNQLRLPAYDALKLLFAGAKQAGFELLARSGYRSYNTQVALYSSYVNNHGQEAADTFSAKPGQSEHQTGLSMDITSESMNYQLSEQFGDTDEGKWVSENAHKYGFIIRYPKGKENVTGYMYEPWHIRYLGVELATEVYESNLTLEEYLEQ